MRAMTALTVSVGFSVGLWSSAAMAQQNWTNVEVKQAIRHDVSPNLRDIKSAPRDPLTKKEALRVRPIPLPRQEGPLAADRAVQNDAGARISTTDVLNFAGVGEGDYGYSDQYAPPDTVGAIGKTQYVQWVNVDMAVFDKSTGAILLGPIPAKNIWKGFGGGCETNNDGDPLVLYDRLANRWIVSQFSVSTTPYLECVAVSKSADATGKYYRYAFDYGNLEFPDYPKMGVWPNGYYVTYNIFTGGAIFTGSKVCAFDRAAMLTGAPATQQCVQLSDTFGGLLPSDLDGKRLPPSGAPNYIFALGQTNTTLDMWKYNVDFATPANTTFVGPEPIPVSPYSPACGGGACIPQQGTTQRLDSLADRLMHRVAYRRFKDGHEAVVINHSVNGGRGRTGIRWYEIRDPGGVPTVFQSGTFAPKDGLFRWMGSIGMDKVGDIAVGYSTSSASDFPSIAYSGREPSDMLGRLQTQRVVQAGGGSQSSATRNLSRWGDYSALTIDPTDDCTFWFTTEYLKTTGIFNWSTRINSFKFPGCS